jgi:hypothetical protein
MSYEFQALGFTGKNPLVMWSRRPRLLLEKNTGAAVPHFSSSGVVKYCQEKFSRSQAPAWERN